MPKPKLVYFEHLDVLHLVLSDEPEGGSFELNPHITVELNANGEIIGLEILKASRFLCDSLLESVHAQLLQTTKVDGA